MKLLYCDETNLNARRNDFFIYGGVIIDSEESLELSNSINNIRTRFGVESQFLLKFAPPPGNLNHERFIEMKQNIFESAERYGVKLITSMIHRSIGYDVEATRINEINRVLLCFNNYLNSVNDVGIVLLDRFSGRAIDGNIRRKMAEGIEGLPYTPHYQLDRIVGIHYSAIGQSHFTSLIDIVIGTVRFVVNSISRETVNAYPISRVLLGLIGPLCIRDRQGLVSENSLFFSPRIIRAHTYRATYERVHAFFANCGLTPHQEIRSE